MGNFARRRRFCKFTEEGIEHIDYKEVDLLREFITESGRVLPNRITGTKSGPQRQLTRAIKRARIVALLPFCDLHEDS